MLEDGLFAKFPCNAVYALHNWPALPLGRCVVRDGAMMAAFATFEIVISGRGCHGAMPHEGADPIVAACQVGSAVQSITSRNVSPLKAAVVSMTQIHAGDAWNVVPDNCFVRGTTRWFDEDVGDLIARRLDAIAHSVSQGFECSATTLYQHRYPPTINDAAEATIVRALASRPDLGLEVVDSDPSMAAEDFAFMLRERPGCYIWLGGQRAGPNPGLHSSRYDFNDAIIPSAANLWLRIVEEKLAS